MRRQEDLLTSREIQRKIQLERRPEQLITLNELTELRELQRRWYEEHPIHLQ